MIIFKKQTSFLGLFFALTLMQGCASLLPAPSPAPKLLNIDTPHANSGIISNKVLAIEEPTAPVLYDSTHILVQKQTDTGLKHFAFVEEAQWVDRLPKILQRSLFSHLKSSSFPNVTMDSKSISNGYALQSDLHKFHIRSPGFVEVEINVSILKVETNTVLKTHTFTYALESDHSMASYVKAFEALTKKWVEDCTNLLVPYISS